MKLIPTLFHVLLCLLIASLVLLVAGGIQIELTVERQLTSLPAHIDARLDVIQRLADERSWQAIDAVNGAVDRADERTKQALQIVQKIEQDVPSLVDRHAASLETILDSQLTTANGTLAANTAPIGDLARRYTLLPDQIRADRETQGLIAETLGVLGIEDLR